MIERTIAFWDCDEGQEDLTWTDRDRAIEVHLNDIAQADWPETLKVYGFARTPVRPEDCGEPLGDVLERLDEEHGDPEEATTATDAMRAAEADFLRAICAEYDSWACEAVTSVTISVMDWVREHNPNWIAQ